MKDHKELDVWRASVDLVTDVYTVTMKFPKEELFGLTNQLRRAAVSIPSNISEGAARQTEKEFVQFLHIALGSVAELETQLIIAENLRYVDKAAPLLSRLASVRKMLHGLVRHYRSKGNSDE
jgi:four helix bundle protein